MSTVVLMFENSPLVDLVVGRSTVRQRLLALLMDQSCGRLHLRELQRRAGTSPGTASRELARLVAVGLIEREAEGSQVYFRATATPFATTLRALLVSMPAPYFKPRPSRVPRMKPTAVETIPAAGPETRSIAVEPALVAIETAAAQPVQLATIEPVMLEPTQAAGPVSPEPAALEPVDRKSVV